MKTLFLLKWRDKKGRQKEFRLVKQVSAKWKRFGVILGVTSNDLDALEEQYRGKAESCWREVMRHWLEGGGGCGYPASWSGLCTLLRDAEYAEIANQVKRVVDRAIVPPPAPTRDTKAATPTSTSAQAQPSRCSLRTFMSVLIVAVIIVIFLFGFR